MGVGVAGLTLLPDRRPNSRRFAERAPDRAAVGADSAVLDVAAGTGALALTAVGRGHQKVTAIDRSPDMVQRLRQRLGPFPGCSAEVMDARELRYPDHRFDAAFSVFGVLLLGADALTAVRETVRVVRPGGLVSVVHRAGPVGGAPVFVPLARAIQRLGDPEVGSLPLPVFSDFLEREEVEQVLVDAGCVDVQSEEVTEPFSLPTARSLNAFLRIIPQYNAAISRYKDEFTQILDQEISRLDLGERGAQGRIASGRVPE
ncbi:class I SAM-dependent methyltransferase [Streptomyces sp. NPDC101181]|uniref:class I SAM-dependent methyltransferase n=1 Tax=Streptomyces sp. NPDC101181 TaxID=3366125 RepID=UPI0037F3914D